MRFQWLLDGGCSTHVTATCKWFTSYVQIPKGKQKILLAKKAGSCALGWVNVTLKVWDRERKWISRVVLKDILHVPACGSNSLLSVSQLWLSCILLDFLRDRRAALMMDYRLLINFLRYQQTLSRTGSEQ